MCLSISEYKGSSEAEWNEEPGAYVFKSQLSQAQSLLYNTDDVTRTRISFDSVHSYSRCSICMCEIVCVCVCVQYHILLFLLFYIIIISIRLSYYHYNFICPGFCPIWSN